MQVLDNLIANAVKFSRRNRRVRVKAACDGRRWRIDVADSGIGIPADEAGQLFDRFVRASNARTAGLPGPAWACPWSRCSSRCTGDTSR